MIYETEEDSPWGPGIPVVTQSMMKAFLQCPREVYYKYVLRLQPKRVSTPLTRGKWVHALLETYYKSLLELDGEPTAQNKASAQEELWQEHRRWSSRFSKLFDEEKDKLGNLPLQISQLMEGYFYHYGDPRYSSVNEWKIVGVEQTLEARLPNGHIFRGRYDMLVEREDGLWLVDHKTHKRMPDWAHRMMDVQAPMYTWAAHENDMPVNGFIWNYIVTADRTLPELLKNGQRLSKPGWSNAEYPAVVKLLRELGWLVREDTGWHLNSPSEEYNEELKARLKELRNRRWAPDTLDSSPHFRRDEIIHDPHQVEMVVATAARTSERMHSYDYSTPDLVERNTNQCKGWMCSYPSLSMADLVSGDSSRIQRAEYQVGDPLKYYEGSDSDEVL